MVWRDPDTPEHLAFSAWRREQVGGAPDFRAGRAVTMGDVMDAQGFATPGEVRRAFDAARQQAIVERDPGGDGGDGGGAGGDGGGGGGGGGGTPSADDLAALIPGLPDNIASLYADLWAEHGNGDLALAHLRQTSEHRQAFPGIRREDGSLRFNEQTYLAQRQGFRNAMREFGLDPEQADVEGLFRNEVKARQFAQTLGQVVDTFTAPGADPPRGLVQQFVNEFTSTGSSQEALSRVRDSSDYERLFPGIRRDDGSLVMDEASYFAHREGMRRTFQQWGLNPRLFEGHHAELIQGEVSLDELDARIQAKVEGVMQNVPETRERFGSFYGIDAMDDNALIAAAIDPEIGLGLLQGRISAAQVSGEAAMAGFDRGRARSERLAQAGGLGQQQARQLFSQAARAVPRFDRFGRRFRGGEFGIEDFEEASVFGDAEQQRRMGRLEASEQALFRRGGQLSRDEQGFQGLRRR